MKTIAATVLSLTLMEGVCAQTNQPGRPDGQEANPPAVEQSLVVSRGGTRPQTQAPAENFTGTVRIDPLFTAEAPARASAATVTFSPGPDGLAHPPAGPDAHRDRRRRPVQRWGGPMEEIRPGDVISIPPGEKHWHGASPPRPMTHLAIHEALDGKAVDWMEKVSDAQYDPLPGGGRETPSGTPAARRERNVCSATSRPSWLI